MKIYLFLIVLIISVTISNCPIAFAACDPQNDGDCCINDSDCTVYVNPALCVILPLNKYAAEKLAKENQQPSAGCKEESIEKLKSSAKNMQPICISHGCDFKETGE